jgi:hypothetical protein
VKTARSGLGALPGGGPAASAQASWSLVKTGVFREDLYLAGDRVISAGRRGDAFIAGAPWRWTASSRAISSSGVAPSSSAESMGDDVRVAGQIVTVDAVIRDMLIVAGEWCG